MVTNYEEPVFCCRYVHIPNQQLSVLTCSCIYSRAHDLCFWVYDFLGAITKSLQPPQQKCHLSCDCLNRKAVGDFVLVANRGSTPFKDGTH